MKAKKEGGQACANFQNCDTKLSAKLMFEDPVIKYNTPTHNRTPIMFKISSQLWVENRSQLSWCTHGLQVTGWIHLIDPREVSKNVHLLSSHKHTVTRQVICCNKCFDLLHLYY